MAEVQFQGVRASAAVQVQRPRINYKPYAEHIAKSELSGVPENLQTEAKKLFAAADSRGLLNEVTNAIREFGKLDNDYLRNFVGRLHEAIDSGALVNKRDFETMVGIMREHPAAADSIPQYMVNLQGTLGDRFRSLSVADLGSITRRTIGKSASLCPKEMVKTTVEMVQRGEFEDVRQIAELRQEMNAETSTTPGTIMISDCQTMSALASTENSKQITPGQIQTDMREAAFIVPDCTYRGKTVAQNSRPVDAVTIINAMKTETTGTEYQRMQTPAPNTRDTIAITRRPEISVVLASNQFRAETNGLRRPKPKNITISNTNPNPDMPKIYAKPTRHIATEEPKRQKIIDDTATRRRPKTLRPRRKMISGIEVRNSTRERNEVTSTLKQKRLTVQQQKMRIANIKDRSSKKEKTSKKTTPTNKIGKRLEKHERRRKTTNSPIGRKLNTKNLQGTKKESANKRAAHNKLPNLELKTNRMRAKRATDSEMKTKRPESMQRESMRQAHQKNKRKKDNRQKKPTVRKKTAPGKLKLALLLSGWRTKRTRKRIWQRR